MGEAQPVAAIDREIYLRWEAEQAEKHEYLAGEVFAMVGVRREHAIVTLALGSGLREHLKGTPCQTFVADMKLLVEAADACFYPDVMVTCDERDRRAELVIEHPVLVVEVLSASTAAFDRGAKFAAYRKLPGLQEYLLVDIDQRRLELYRRSADHWQLFDTDANGTLSLDSVAMSLGTAAAFEDLQPPAAQAARPG
ncbi:Uma2 family endonuclease [Pseudothauera lacus]|uniref:Uma2 family endonuclease n=1 Tax=Pseudothauera lacus TaxID=2136175 RepID=A0A2T4ICP1_9RHOO|nr:Uma2 family endonuclease [Pseudothauera lacus]PTD95496.1 Uma2 family endonuclease [Pseudothauera lacus]